MSKDISLNASSLKGTAQSISKFHYLIYIALMLGGVAYTVYKINAILNIPTDTAYQAEQQKALLNDNFDQATIDRLKKLNYSTDPKPVVLPPGRNNPFTE